MDYLSLSSIKTSDVAKSKIDSKIQIKVLKKNREWLRASPPNHSPNSDSSTCLIKPPQHILKNIMLSKDVEESHESCGELILIHMVCYHRLKPPFCVLGLRPTFDCGLYYRYPLCMLHLRWQKHRNVPNAVVDFF